MIFSRIPGRRLRHACACLAAVAALASCGGGTEQFESFVAGRVFAFGDENSALTTTGLKYSVNGFTTVTDAVGNTTEVADCSAQPTWVQSLAAIYGYVFQECNPTGSGNTNAIMRAFAGAKVADFKVQIDSQIAAGGFRDRDLAAVMMGANDIIELYQQYPVRTEADLTAEARARGVLLAQQINRLVDLGVKIILATLPDMGLTPYAYKERANFTGVDRAALLSRLTAAFNEQLGVNIVLDGRFIGLVQTDLRTQSMAVSPGAYGLINIGAGVCLPTSPPPDCNSKTLVDGGTALNYMWSDDLRMAYSVQNQIAALAIDRARRNPF